MTLEEHNKELRRRALSSLAVFALLFIGVYYFNKTIIDFIIGLGKSVGYSFIALTPQEVFIQALRISGNIALLLGAPFCFIQIVIFIAPIFESKKTVFFIYLLGIVAFFMVALGIFFSVKVLLPFTVKYLYSFSQNYSVVSEISFEKFLSFVIAITLALGVVFLMPIFSIILGKLGIISYDGMKKAFPVIVVLILFISAIITPPDVISQCIVAIPITILYGISMAIVKFLRRKECLTRKNHE